MSDQYGISETRAAQQRNRKIPTPLQLLFVLFMIGIAAEVLSLFIFGGSFLHKIVYELGRFPDYFNHIRRNYLGLENIYLSDQDACFPPLACTYYYLLSRILYQDNIADPSALETSASGMLLICIHTALFAILFLCAFERLSRSSSAKSHLLAIMIFVSYPFWIAMERGNMTEWVLILLMFAMALKDSSKPVYRELALILIAIAASVKLYPAIFGLLYLTEKRWKEALRLVIYGLLFFFVPFAWFGGLWGLQLFLKNITAVGSGATGVTIVGLTGRIGQALGLSLAAGHQIGKVIALLYFILVVLFAFLLRRQTKWQTIAQITSLMIVFVSESGSYCLLYWTIPLVFFLKEERKKDVFSRLDYLYAVLFSLVFVAYPVSAAGSSGMLYGALYLLLAVLMLDQIHAAATLRQHRKQAHTS